MKGSMKKLAVFVVITVIAPFIMADIASPWQHAIRGKYAYTGETTCLISPSGFTDKLQPIAGWGIIQTYSREGKVTFELNGTGSADLFSRVVALPYSVPNVGSFPPSAGTQEVTYDFTYTLTNDGTITITVVPGTFISTWITGPSKPASYLVEGVLTDGVITPISWDNAITPDGKTITFTAGAPDVFKLKRIDAPAAPNYSICHNSGVLIWVRDHAGHHCDRD